MSRGGGGGRGGRGGWRGGRGGFGGKPQVGPDMPDDLEISYHEMPLFPVSRKA
jgi:hypothetical protein